MPIATGFMACAEKDMRVIRALADLVASRLAHKLAFVPPDEAKLHFIDSRDPMGLELLSLSPDEQHHAIIALTGDVPPTAVPSGIVCLPMPASGREFMSAVDRAGTQIAANQAAEKPRPVRRYRGAIVE